MFLRYYSGFRLIGIGFVAKNVPIKRVSPLSEMIYCIYCFLVNGFRIQIPFNQIPINRNPLYCHFLSQRSSNAAGHLDGEAPFGFVQLGIMAKREKAAIMRWMQTRLVSATVPCLCGTWKDIIIDERNSKREEEKGVGEALWGGDGTTVQ